MTEILPNIFYCKLPEGYWATHINKDGDIESYPEDGGGGIKPIAHVIHLLDGSYTILFTRDEADEEKWKEVVRYFEMDCKYKDYTPMPDIEICGMYHPLVNTATESGASLLKSKGLSTEDNYVIILKQ